MVNLDAIDNPLPQQNLISFYVLINKYFNIIYRNIQLLQNSDDSSDEEVLLRVGNIPKHWYDLYDHKGYGVDGK